MFSEKQDGFSVYADTCTEAAKIVKNYFQSPPFFHENPFESAENSLRNSGFVPSYLACQEFQKSGKPLKNRDVRFDPAHVERRDYPNESYVLEHFKDTVVIREKSVDFYKQKVKVSGNVVKIRSCEKMQFRGQKTGKPEPVVRERTPEEIAKQTLANGNRARDKIIDILNSNFGMYSRVDCEGNKSVKFLTLTYAENMLDLSRSYYESILWLQRLEYFLHEKVEYMLIPERQKRGAWHIHALLYCSWIPPEWLLANWNEARGQGSYDIHEVREVGDLGKYVAKYVSKTFMEGGVLPGKHRYWCSQGLRDKSTVIYTRQPSFRLLDFVDYFDGYIDTKKNGDLAVRMGHYGEGNVYTGRIDFLDIVLIPCKEVEYMLKTLESWISRQ